jgi:hypothetical protein
LRGSQSLELGNIRMQFQFGGNHLPHRTNVQYFTENVKYYTCEYARLKPHTRNAAFLHFPSKGTGLLRRSR